MMRILLALLLIGCAQESAPIILPEPTLPDAGSIELTEVSVPSCTLSGTHYLILQEDIGSTGCAGNHHMVIEAGIVSFPNPHGACVYAIVKE